MHSKLKSLALGGVASLAITSVALAQVNTVPQVGFITGTLNKSTYSAVSIGLVPAASATDIFCISGSATKTIKISGIRITGVAGTLTTVPLVVLRRASLDTGGTAALTTAAPNLTNGASDSNNPTATATLIAYTANPTIVDTSPMYFRAQNLTTPTVAAGTNTPPVDFTFGSTLPNFTQPLVVRGVAQQVCLNLQASSISSGVLNIGMQWTEE